MRTPAAARPFIDILDRYSGAVLAENCISLGENAIHFATGKFTVPEGAERVLSEVADQLKVNSNWKWEVGGYTDNVGSKAANQKLSEERARAVANWLAAHGVDRDRLAVSGQRLRRIESCGRQFYAGRTSQESASGIDPPLA